MEKLTKEKLKRIFLILAILPYIMFLLIGLYNFIISGAYRISEIFQPIQDFWLRIAFAPRNIAYLLLMIFSIGYLIYFFITKNKDKKEKKDKKNKKIDIPRIILYLSFIPYIYLIFIAVFGIKTGFFLSTTRSYGLDAIFMVLLYGTMIPIYPVIVLYQLIYFIIAKKKKLAKRKTNSQQKS